MLGDVFEQVPSEPRHVPQLVERFDGGTGGLDLEPGRPEELSELANYDDWLMSLVAPR